MHSLHFPSDEIPREPEEVANATAILDKCLSKHGIPYLMLFFLSNDKEHITHIGVDQNMATLTIMWTTTVARFVY